MSATLYAGDNVEVLRRVVQDASVQLTVTSPPYDNLRKYNGFTWDFEALARELYRVTKNGGVVVWVVADATVNGSETGTSFRQALYFKECGFNLHDTMLYRSAKPPISRTASRYQPEFEFAFVLSKGKPGIFNALTEPSIHAGKTPKRNFRQADGELRDGSNKAVADTKLRGNIWSYGTGGFLRPQDAGNHPAIFPEGLAQDHILSWSNTGDTVLDPFVGSGTTGKMAVINSRSFIGVDISHAYVDLSKSRIPGAEIRTSLE